MIEIKKLVFVNILTCDMSLTDARLFNLFIKTFVYNCITIADVISYNVAL